MKLIPTDVYQAQTLVEIALQYAESPQPIDPATFNMLKALI